tara:strand:- start:579 stop:1133 length:555 start_codon:yes stop_codon:yes gene_type:complete
MKSYKILNKQIFHSGIFSLVPIRFQDRFDIMNWRNEQIYHLRQDKPLTIKSQDIYFNTVISNLFEQEQPNQILFSMLENDKCVGYGGLVHINWIDKNAEISFIMDTDLEEEYFHSYWTMFLEMIENLAFGELNLHKLYVYAFDLRPNLYDVLLASNYFRDAVLNNHSYFKGRYIDVVIHSKLKK